LLMAHSLHCSTCLTLDQIRLLCIKPLDFMQEFFGRWNYTVR